MNKTKNTLFKLLVVITLLASVSSLTTYQYTFDTISRYNPSYSLGYIPGGYTVMVNMSTTGTGPNALAITALVPRLEPDTWVPPTGVL